MPFKPSKQETETGESLWVSDQTCLYSETPFQNQNQTKTKNQKDSAILLAKDTPVTVFHIRAIQLDKVSAKALHRFVIGVAAQISRQSWKLWAV